MIFNCTGVTYCGYSGASPLTMSNVPFQHEVIEFVRKLLAYVEQDSYEISCEHEHSCSILLSNTKFRKADGWYTWIDYPKFHQVNRDVNLVRPRYLHDWFLNICHLICYLKKEYV
jgi:wyosine [tRNA(Phe)-imidazoG37] synthetase (radical SAM superfamily)